MSGLHGLNFALYGLYGLSRPLQLRLLAEELLLHFVEPIEDVSDRRALTLRGFKVVDCAGYSLAHPLGLKVLLHLYGSL